jgi:hypothetical protein
MAIMSLFYLVASVSEWFYVQRCYQEIINKNLKCLNDDYLVSVNNKGSYILLYNSLIIYLYACVMIWVFYFIPRQEGRAVTGAS